MAFAPLVKLKMDELFIRWMTDDAAQSGLKQSLSLLKSGNSVASKKAMQRIQVPSPRAHSDRHVSPYPQEPHFNHRHVQGSISNTLYSPCVSPRPSTPPQFPVTQRTLHDKQPQSPRRSPAHGRLFKYAVRLLV